MTVDNDFSNALTWLASAHAESQRKFDEKRKKLCDVLKHHGIRKVVAAFDGSGDSGEVYSLRFTPDLTGFGGTEIPGTEADRHYYDPDKGYSTKRRCQTVAEAVEDFCYVLLSDNHPGWEINEGSHGDITLDVATGKCKVGINHRIVEENYEEGEY